MASLRYTGAVKRGHKHESTSGGFSLLEMTVVVAVVVILAAIAIPAISYWLEQYRLGIAAQQVADALQATKMQAVAKTRRTELLFDVAGNRLGREGSELAGLPPGVRFAQPSQTLPPDPAVNMSAAVTFPPLAETSTLRSAAFSGRGLPVGEPGEVYAVFLSNSTGSSAVLMTSAGNVRIVYWDGGSWK